jgi:hypothetical protein
MLNKLSGFLHRISNGRFLALLAIVFVVMNLFLALSPSSPINALRRYADGSILDMEFNFSPDRAYDVLSAYGDTGRQYYASVFSILDLITPVVMNIFLAALLSIISRQVFAPYSHLQAVNLLPLGALVADYLENLGIVLLIRFYPLRLEGLARAASLATDFKFLFTFASLVFILIGLVTWLVKRRRSS